MQHDGAYAGLARHLLGGADDRLEHRDVERVVLVGPGQRHDRDVVGRPRFGTRLLGGMEQSPRPPPPEHPQAAACSAQSRYSCQ